MAHLTIRLLDENGVENPLDNSLLEVETAGPGELYGVANGNLYDSDPYRGPRHRAYMGRMLAVLRSTKEPGEIRVTVRLGDLRAQALISSKKPE